MTWARSSVGRGWGAMAARLAKMSAGRPPLNSGPGPGDVLYDVVLHLTAPDASQAAQVTPEPVAASAGHRAFGRPRRGPQAETLETEKPCRPTVRRTVSQNRDGATARQVACRSPPAERIP